MVGLPTSNFTFILEALSVGAPNTSNLARGSKPDVHYRMHRPIFTVVGAKRSIWPQVAKIMIFLYKFVLMGKCSGA